MEAQALTEKNYTTEEKISLCQRLSALPPSKTKEFYTLILEHSKSCTASFPRRMGSKTVIPFGGRKNGDDYEFEINHLPNELLQVMEQLFNADQVE